MKMLNRNLVTEGVGKVVGQIFLVLYEKKWFKWFIRITLGLIILSIIKNVGIAFTRS